MKQKLQLLIILCFLCVLPAALFAQETAIQAQPCTQPGKLTMWVWDDHWAEIIEKSIEIWATEYCPGSQVDLQVHPYDEYWSLLNDSIAGDQMPDVFNISQDRFFYYANQRALLNLQPYLDAASVDVSIWEPSMIEPYRLGAEGALYAAPVNWDTIVIFYNKDLFDARNIPYPNSEWTWDGFEAAAAALTDKLNGIYGAAVYAEYQSGYANWVASTGIPPVVGAARTQCTLTESRSVGALKFLKNLYDKGYMPTIATLGGASADDEFTIWLNGKVAMVSAGSWKLPTALSEAKFRWDVVQLPKHPETERSRAILHSVGYAGSATTADPDLVANLILYLSSDEGQTFFAEAGGVAPANPTLQERWIESFHEPNINIQAFVDAKNDSQGVTVFTEIWDTINTTLIVNIFDADMSVEDATRRACEFVNQQLRS